MYPHFRVHTSHEVLHVLPLSALLTANNFAAVLLPVQSCCVACEVLPMYCCQRTVANVLLLCR
jgi:hypothetical protein